LTGVCMMVEVRWMKWSERGVRAQKIQGDGANKG
jgi:hypothetical protein